MESFQNNGVKIAHCSVSCPVVSVRVVPKASAAFINMPLSNFDRILLFKLLEVACINCTNNGKSIWRSLACVSRAGKSFNDGNIIFIYCGVKLSYRTHLALKGRLTFSERC